MNKEKKHLISGYSREIGESDLIHYIIIWSIMIRLFFLNRCKELMEIRRIQ
jgi:hypothetical protein